VYGGQVGAQLLGLGAGEPGGQLHRHGWRAVNDGPSPVPATFQHGKLGRTTAETTTEPDEVMVT
jgi:hypothetical protein